jgi:hypothetical protein
MACVILASTAVIGLRTAVSSEGFCGVRIHHNIMRRLNGSVMDARWWVLPVVYAVLFLGVVLPVAVGWRATEASFDEGRCYLPAITQLRAKFPSVDLLQDSLSASPPGYSHLLAFLSLATGDSLRAHRAWHAVLSLVGAIFVLWLAARLTGLQTVAVAAMLPMVSSSYYLKSAAQLTTDNLALALTFSALLLVFFAQDRPRSAFVAGALGLACVWVRHNAIWLAAPMALKSLLLLSRRNRPTAVAWVIAALAMLLVVAVFVWAWGGLVPPIWSRAHEAPSLSSLVYACALAGIFGAVFFPAGTRMDIRSSDLLVALAGVVVGAGLFLLSDMAPSYEAGRFGGPLWALAGQIPLVAGRAYIFLPLAAAGAGLLALAAWRLFARSPAFGLLWTSSLCAWLATGIVNRQIFHRYYEGPILGFWGLWILLMAFGDSARFAKSRCVLLYLLAAALFAAGAYSMLTSPTGFTAPLNPSLLNR